MKLSEYNKIHFVGIGGISMSGLAEILHDKGFKVVGSDRSSSETTIHLSRIGIKIYIPQKKDNIENDVDLIVYTAAVKEDNPEIVEGRKRGIKVIDRAELVGTMMDEYNCPISIAGTHGKTTTTSMITEIYIAAEKNPTVSVGGILHSIGGNIRLGENNYFIVESCEYCDSFLKFKPKDAIILNIDKDHTDYFETLEDIYKSFRKFSETIPKDGTLIINNNIPNVNVITDGLKCNVITYGNSSDSDWYPENIIFNEEGTASYDAVYKGIKKAHIELSVPGMHNILNSLSACAQAYNNNIEIEFIEKGLNNFKGTHRRFEYMGTFNDVKVIDDYAHHPTEIKSTISAAKAHNINDLWCVFQPHTFSRTKSLLNEFAESFDEADNIVLLDIYAAREKDTGEIHSKDLLKKLTERGKKAYYFKNFEEASQFLISTCKPNDMLITMGAGDVNKLGEMLIK